MRKNVLFIILALSGFVCRSQHNDAGLWMSISAEKKVCKSLTAIISPEFRMSENFSELGTLFFDAGVEYKFNKHIRTSINYRFTGKRLDNDDYSKRHRWYADLKLRYKSKPLLFNLRTRFQSQFTDMFSSPDGLTPEYYLRNKFSVKYDTDKKVNPYISTEIFTPAWNNANVVLDNIRYAAGVDYKISKDSGIDLFYLIQLEYNVENPKTDYIIGIGYSISF